MQEGRQSCQLDVAVPRSAGPELLVFGHLFDLLGVEARGRREVARGSPLILRIKTREDTAEGLFLEPLFSALRSVGPRLLDRLRRVACFSGVVQLVLRLRVARV